MRRKSYTEKEIIDMLKMRAKDTTLEEIAVIQGRNIHTLRKHFYSAMKRTEKYGKYINEIKSKKISAMGDRIVTKQDKIKKWCDKLEECFDIWELKRSI